MHIHDQNHSSSPGKVLLLVLTAALCFSPLIACDTAQAQGKPLKGSASLDDIYKKDGPSLNRQDIDNAGDPFGSEADSFDAPESSFASQTPMPENPPPFNLNANQGGNGAPMQAMQGTPGMQPQQPINVTPPQQAAAQDPESVGQMKLAWDQWHKRVAESIYVKYNGLARVAFKRSRPLAARVAYTVTRNGQITNVRLIQRSPNLIFNTMIFGVLKSMNGNPILTFPQGSQRMTVEKTGTFLWNYNNVQGFKYTTNDKETIPQR